MPIYGIGGTSIQVGIGENDRKILYVDKEEVVWDV